MKILLPVDGSALSLEAVRHAIDLVRNGLRASCVLANVQEPGTLYEVLVAHDAQVVDDMRARAGVHLLQDGEKLLTEAGIDYEIEVASGGDAAHALVDIIENFGCDAVIMGAWGAGPDDSAPLGSVAAAMTRSSPVPVTVVRPREPAPDNVEDGDGDGDSTL
jgi:nucleotide-binding universal stress UspA family protein